MDTANNKPVFKSPGKVLFADADAAALLSPRTQELCRPQDFGWEQVKHNPARTVYRGLINGRMIYIKHYHNPSLSHRIGRLLGASDAKKEMEYANYLSARGVPTAPALAAMCSGGVEWLVTEAVAPAMPADQWHAMQLARGAAGQRAIQRAIVSMGQMVGRMHATGIIHKDLHCGNVLVRIDPADPDAPVQLVLTDLHRAARHRRLSRRTMAANLAQLMHDRTNFTTRTERVRFLLHYLKTSQAKGTLRGWQLLVEDFAYRHTHRQNAQKDRRIFAKNRYFSPVQLSNGWQGHVVLASKRRTVSSKVARLELTAEDWLQALQNPETLSQGPDVQVVKDSPSCLVFRRHLAVGPHNLDVFIKQPRRKQPWKFLLDLFRVSRVRRSFYLGHMLLSRRIATALPLAMLERRVWGAVTDSILITETIQGQQLNDFLETWLSRPARVETTLTPVQQKQFVQEVLWQLGRMVQRLHDNHFAHRDLKAGNVFICGQETRTPEVVLIDLDGLKWTRVLTMRRRFQGLMRLNVSLLNCPSVNRAGRLRMLLGYIRRPGSGRINFKPYWRVLENWSARKIRQQIRSRRKRQKATRRPGP